jgi:hypothetical protein
MPAKGRIDTAGIGDLVRDLGKIDRSLRSALVKELRDIGNEVRDKVRSSTQPPFGPTDSKGEIGRKRHSIKTGVRRGAISLYSLEPDSAVWNWGGSISPRGAPIQIPRTEFLTSEIYRQGDHVDDRLTDVLDRTAARYQFR